MRRIRSILTRSPALAISAIALVLSLSSGAYAAGILNGAQLAHSTIPANRLQPHSVTSFQLRSANVTWHRLVLRNGWTAEPAATNQGKPRYARSNGIIYLSGALHQPSGTSNIIAYLPRGYRPSHNLSVPVVTGLPPFGYLWIQPNGAVKVFTSPAASGQAFTSLAGVSFPVNS